MRVVRIVLILIAAIIGGGLLRDRIPESAWDRFLLPYRIIQLAAQPADEVLPMPVAGASMQSVADTWGAARGGVRKHEGEDIFAPRGTRVVSVTRGIVLRIGENRLGGKSVSVAGPGGRTYYYAHLDAYAGSLRVAQQVTPGTVLGFVGNTGNAKGTPPHLHFGVYGLRGALNPLGRCCREGAAGAPRRPVSECEADPDCALHRVRQSTSKILEIQSVGLALDIVSEIEPHQEPVCVQLNPASPVHPVIPPGAR